MHIMVYSIITNLSLVIKVTQMLFYHFSAKEYILFKKKKKELYTYSIKTC